MTDTTRTPMIGSVTPAARSGHPDALASGYLLDGGRVPVGPPDNIRAALRHRAALRGQDAASALGEQWQPGFPAPAGDALTLCYGPSADGLVIMHCPDGWHSTEDAVTPLAPGLCDAIASTEQWTQDRDAFTEYHRERPVVWAVRDGAGWLGFCDSELPDRYRALASEPASS